MPSLQSVGLINNGMACAYCGRRDQPDYAGNCNGCGAVHTRSEKIDITTINNTLPKFVFAYSGILSPNELLGVKEHFYRNYRGR